MTNSNNKRNLKADTRYSNAPSFRRKLLKANYIKQIPKLEFNLKNVKFNTDEIAFIFYIQCAAKSCFRQRILIMFKLGANKQLPTKK